MSDKPPIVIQDFPKFEAFDLEANIADGYFLAQLIQENHNHIICLFLAPLTKDLDNQEPMIIGQVSAGRAHEVVEYDHHLNTKCSHAILCIWKPSISTVHAFVARNIRWCFNPEYEEGGKALSTLKEVAPSTRIVVVTPSKIFDGQSSWMNSSIPELVGNIMIWDARKKEEDMPFTEDW
jgi:hypothetical protein